MRDIKSLAFVCALFAAACATTDGGGGGDDGTTPPPTGSPVCGDAVCAASEVGVCQADCGSGNTEVCGNGKCEGNEPTTCAADCATQAQCGNGQCESTESSSTCPGDCTGGGGGIDCNDQNTQFLCIACIGFQQCMGVTENDCTQCFGGGGGGGTGCAGGMPNGMCESAAGENNTTCPFDCP